MSSTTLLVPGTSMGFMGDSETEDTFGAKSEPVNVSERVSVLNFSLDIGSEVPSDIALSVYQ